MTILCECDLRWQKVTGMDSCRSHSGHRAGGTHAFLIFNSMHISSPHSGGGFSLPKISTKKGVFWTYVSDPRLPTGYIHIDRFFTEKACKIKPWDWISFGSSETRNHANSPRRRIFLRSRKYVRRTRPLSVSIGFMAILVPAVISPAQQILSS